MKKGWPQGFYPFSVNSSHLSRIRIMEVIRNLVLWKFLCFLIIDTNHLPISLRGSVIWRMKVILHISYNVFGSASKFKFLYVRGMNYKKAIGRRRE